MLINDMNSEPTQEPVCEHIVSCFNDDCDSTNQPVENEGNQNMESCGSLTSSSS